MSVICVKKLKGFDEESNKWQREAEIFLNIKGNFNFYDIYDFGNISDNAFSFIVKNIFNDNTNEYFKEVPEFSGKCFRYSEVTGQYNEREDMVKRVSNVLLDEEIKLNHSRIVECEGISDEDFKKFKDYFLNPVENMEIPMEGREKKIFESPWDELQPVEGFREFSDEELNEFKDNFSFDLQDLKLVREHFIEEGRDPNISELKVIDTYWSDHCRHTTFMTEIEDVEFETGLYEDVVENAFKDYLDAREYVYGEKKKPISLMDLGTINARILRKKGELDDEDKSDEVNACTVNVKVNVGGEDKDYLLYFKNETHNHPTEIEPFGGASTCIGGGIRDPLSGRSFPYQGLRITGSKSPLTPYEDTIPGKRPSRQICKVALEGFTDYANQIGINAGIAKEFYHPGFEAKRLELGALVAATPKDYVRREAPVVGDVILLIGADTGRDGLGAAVGSSKIQTDESLEKAGTDVQKGNPSAERKIIRLFNNKKASKLIKKCNDFGAGGVSVAIGELADGLNIDLNKVPVKYPGMHPGEIALSESQERMAVVVSKKDLEEFMSYCEAEDVQAVVVADVTDNGRMEMYYDGKKVIDISRDFLNTNGGRKFANVSVEAKKEKIDVKGSYDLKALVSKLENASQHGLLNNFDATIYSGSVLYPLGGKNMLTPQLGMVHKIPVHLFGGLETKDASVMTYGYDADLAVKSPYYGGFMAIMNSVLKACALGCDRKKIRLSIQEFFESLKGDPKRWGKPFEALLGAFYAMDNLNLPSIGGKDSMSGSFEDIDVPPSLFSFAVAMTDVDKVVSREFKEKGSDIVLIDFPLLKDGAPDFEKLKSALEFIKKALEDKKVLAISNISSKGGALDLFEMAVGNDIGFEIDDEYVDYLFTENKLGYLIETKDSKYFEEFGKVIGKTGDAVKLGKTYDLEDLKKAWTEPLKSVYEVPKFTGTCCKEGKAHEMIKSDKKVVIPVALGANGEYDLKKEFVLRGCEVEEVIVKLSSKKAYEESLTDLASKIKSSDVLAFPHGATMGDEPQMEGKLEELILRNEKIKDAVEELLAKGGKVLGVGSGFKGLIRAGLIEHGKISETTDIEIAPTPSMQHLGTVLSACGVKGTALEGEKYFAPYSTRYGVIRADKKYSDKGQVLSTYCKFFEGEPAIDAMQDPTGKIIGVNSIIDRYDEDSFINIDKGNRSGIIDLVLKED